jgi:hypothetical protein
MQAVSDRVGLRASSLRVEDADLERYVSAAMAFLESRKSYLTSAGKFKKSRN